MFLNLFQPFWKSGCFSRHVPTIPKKKIRKALKLGVKEAKNWLMVCIIAAPSIGPINVPMPPNIVMISVDFYKICYKDRI